MSVAKPAPAPAAGDSAAASPAPAPSPTPAAANGNATPQKPPIPAAAFDMPKPNLRGLNKPKCIQCGNVARSRCPFQCCKACCYKAQNPCHIHVLKQTNTLPDKPSPTTAPVSEQPSTNSLLTGSALRLASLQRLPHHFLNALRTKKSLAKKDVVSINKWRFMKLREHMQGEIDVENEAYERYTQNVGLLEEIFCPTQDTDAEPEPETNSEEESMDILVSEAIARLKSDSESAVLLPWLLLLLLASSHGVTALRFTVDDFPDGFAFGAGTAAFQYEGAVAEDGKSPSIWDTYAHSARNPNMDNGDVASDGYHKYKEDVKLIKDIGLKTYRFSISWTRLIPNGRGTINSKGLQFYNNLINELVKEGIQIHAVIYHLDLPQILEDEYGGWLSPRIVDDFTAYADACFREFGDRVAHWTTILEPNILAQGSYDNGIVPPGHCSPPFGRNCTVGNSSVEPYLFLHNTLLAHSSAVRLYREQYQAAQKGVVGINLYSLAIYPLTGSPEDNKATERANDFLFGCILHPFVFGDYPESMKKAAGPRLPSFSNYESNLVTDAFDFIGLNHYSSIYASNNPDMSKIPVRDQAADVGALFRDTKDGPTSIVFPPGRMIDPQGLEYVLKYLQGKYGNISIYIQENGRGQADDSLMDEERIDFLKVFMASTLKSIRDGVNIKGYSVWSLMDLYEIFGGYKAHFGLIRVDFRDSRRQRQPRLSAYWYSDFLNNRVVVEVDNVATYHEQH